MSEIRIISRWLKSIPQPFHRCILRSGVLLILTALALIQSSEAAEKRFVVVVQREKTEKGLIVGKLSVDGKLIGTVYENVDRKIPAGSYRGMVRKESKKNFVQGPGGKLGKTGDFLLEVAGVPGRSDILFHAGDKQKHSTGCILCGPASKDRNSGEWVAPEALRKLRLLFYDGKDNPSGVPNKAITVEVKDP
jgi:hypothetical protein